MMENRDRQDLQDNWVALVSLDPEDSLVNRVKEVPLDNQENQVRKFCHTKLNIVLFLHLTSLLYFEQI